MKRKRRDMCPSPLLDESPKRTKVHAQRKFAQGSNMNSPVITPVEEYEGVDGLNLEVTPEPVELLPIRRPNTEDFLTFLCFRGTPLLPPNLNFFNTASIVDNNGQVHGIKSECHSKNGPIDTSVITKNCSGSSDRPFIAFGVRKRADPIVISKQMEKKRRHALALQALRRKYQEQKMAKIRAVTISKLSEKPSNRVRSNSISKIEKIQHVEHNKTPIIKNKVKVISTKHINITRPTAVHTITTKIKPKMCLRSFRGRFVQQELPFRNSKKLKVSKKQRVNLCSKKKEEIPKTSDANTKKSNDAAKENNKVTMRGKTKIINQNIPVRVTRSNKINLKPKTNAKKIITRRILLSNTSLLKSRRVLRSQTLTGKTSSLSRLNRKYLEKKDPSVTIEKVPKNLHKTESANKNLVNENVQVNIMTGSKKILEGRRTNVAKKIVKCRSRNQLQASTSDRVLRRGSVNNPNVSHPKIPAKLKKDKLVTNKKEKESTQLTELEIVSKNRQNIEENDKDDEPLSNLNEIEEKGKRRDLIRKNKITETCPSKRSENNSKSEEIKDNNLPPQTYEVSEAESQKLPRRPSRKTKEAAAIYMEILSHKLVEKKVEDDNISIDSFPELPNVKKTEQRENELKAKANISKIEKNELVMEKIDYKEKNDKSSDQIIENKINVSTSKKNNLVKKEKDSCELKAQKECDIKAQEVLEKEKQSEPGDKVESETALNVNVSSKIEIVTESQKTLISKKVSSLVATENVEPEDKLVETNRKFIVDVKENKHESEDMKELNKIETKVEKTEKKKVQSEVVDSSDSDECLANISKNEVKSDKKQKSGSKHNLLDNKEQEKEKEAISTKNKIIEKSNSRQSADSDDEYLSNLSKPKDTKTEDGLSRRRTRLSSQKQKQNSDDSEDSFHVDVKIPRKKQITRSRSKLPGPSIIRDKASTLVNVLNEPEESNTSIHEKCSSKGKLENIKKNSDFSDSDEEPLSKLTTSKKEKCDENNSAEKLKEDILRKQKALIDSPPQKKHIKRTSKCILDEGTIKADPCPIKNKPKRECAKNPSNYFPMFSSSDDEEKLFHGFSPQNEKKNENLFPHSSLDFLSKDLERCFEKDKVNMSNERIEKWLKDSALAESDIKKEDELKFCQVITDTSLNSDCAIDTEKLKDSLLSTCETSDVAMHSDDKNSPSQEDSQKALIYKSPGDRKPIFRKQKTKLAPTVGAFSVNNERSIYAFEEENDMVVGTPFRRPVRRPSSTATSKSEDEFSKSDDQTQGRFRKPSTKNDNLDESNNSKAKIKDMDATKLRPNPKINSIRSLSTRVIKKGSQENFDDKYKVPSSPSASSSSSAKLYKRQNKQKIKSETYNPVKMTDFPCNGPGDLVEAPTFYPTEKEFQDPLEYIEKIGIQAEQFGICRIVPPNNFKPECKVSDDMRFTAYNQYVHKMLHRWGSNFKELMAIKKYLHTQNINLTQPPWIGGMEVDLPRLYQTVQSLGGLKEVIEKEKWSKVSDIMRIPKSAQDRVTKLDDIYCKYLLPYDTLSPDEREKLLDEVETEWAKRESKTLSKMQKVDNGEVEIDTTDSDSDNEVEECIMKGRNIALNAFYRIARNTMSMWFKNADPGADDVEKEFWKHVTLRKNHICVHSGSIDSGSWGYGFAVSKNSPFARHAWNLKVLTNNSGSVLRSLGPVMGVTVPTLHVGMVFSACCWYRDPHSLPWIEYLHTGGNKIWYGIPNSVGDRFHNALTKLVPNYCRNHEIWLPSDTVMLPPNLLIDYGVSLSRIVQEPGHFIVVFPKAFTSSVSTGYVVSESVFFAPPSWLKSAQMAFDLLRSSSEPSMFSLERLYLSIINDQRTNVDVLREMIPIVSTIISNEKPKRQKIQSLGVNKLENIPLPETSNARRKKKSQDGGDYECEICRMNLFISLILEQQDNAVYCLDHAIELIQKEKIMAENCKLLFTYSEEDLDGLIDRINQSIQNKLQKKVFNKFTGMPTLLNKQI